MRKQNQPGKLPKFWEAQWINEFCGVRSQAFNRLPLNFFKNRWLKKSLSIYLAGCSLLCVLWDLLLWCTDSLVVPQGLSYPAACGVLAPNQG